MNHNYLKLYIIIFKENGNIFLYKTFSKIKYYYINLNNIIFKFYIIYY